jgi:hypothetical protein
MEMSTSRIVALALLTLFLFGISAFLMLQWMPGPLGPTDYLLVGGGATLISLLGTGLLIFRELPNRSGFLVKRRIKKGGRES